ncbi:MAG: MFS transporter [Bacteroidales bacterium]|nr:MFS transporter [Bacteroidales bacterium]
MKISKLTDKNYKNNFKAFVWHAIFLALMKPFLDTDTIIPAMIIKAGGNEMLIGLATAILVGVSTLFQFFFGSFLSNKKQKKIHLLTAIFTRSTSILGLGLILLWFNILDGKTALILIFFFISIFSVAGAYGGVSYTDLIGKSIKPERRKAMFSIKNFAGAVAFFGAAIVVKYILKLYEFPNNYAILYITAFFLLSIAALGYIILKEKIVIPAPKKKFIEFTKAIPIELKKNPNLKYFLLLINTLGLSITAFPFLISYTKEVVGLSNNTVGNFLIMKVAGMVIFSLIVYYIREKVNYKQLLVVSVFLGTIIPVLAIFFVKNTFMYSILFFLAGSLFSILSIAKEGIILEISNVKNRSEYAGIVGVGSLLTAVLPLFSGFLIATFGYTGVFIGISIVVFSSLYFTLKLKCKPIKTTS